MYYLLQMWHYDDDFLCHIWSYYPLIESNLNLWLHYLLDVSLYRVFLKFFLVYYEKY